ncbi:hypothetical protein MUN88_12465 [Gracilibacillus caseinilyticus]|uniref:YesK-like protein n=1 Tax=Gracilibacillus caseinilyticus TaxID=2932256 RepID=A0ABY4ETF2_9BACI|nr:hypothetical protein [Gracilibacillus caseinilyticus]UOQ46904.1 hypothetical protein MUN88_12465 [Gracilibacillus caseinilyticus]
MLQVATLLFWLFLLFSSISFIYGLRNKSVKAFLISAILLCLSMLCNSKVNNAYQLFVFAPVIPLVFAFAIRRKQHMSGKAG